MKKISFLSGLFAVLVLLAISASSSAAQDVDISGMDDAQLLMLLQAIMQKMDTSEESAAGTSAAAAAEPVRHSIWKNKKLSVEALPDYMFIRQPEEDESVPGKENNNIKKNISHDFVPLDGSQCLPGQHWKCSASGYCGCTWAS